MSRAADLLELIADAVLPLLGEPGTPVAVDRAARDVWANWSRDADARKADLDALRVLPDDAVVEAAARIVKRLLPGRPGPVQANLARYVLALPDLLLIRIVALNTADDIARWLPAVLPRFQAGDTPPGVGDRRLDALVRADARGECWLADNPRLPHLPPVLLAFLPDEAMGLAVAWHVRAARAPCPGLLPLEHTYPGCLQFAAPPPETLVIPCREPGVGHAGVFAETVRSVAALHRRAVPVSVGTVEPGDVFRSHAGVRLLVTAGPLEDDPRGDVRELGRLGRLLGIDQDDYLAGVLTDAVSEDRLRRPSDAQVLLTRLEQGGPLARKADAPAAPEPAARPTTAKRGRVWDVLAGLESGEAKQEKRLVNSAGMAFVLIPKGTFHMGSPTDEAGRRDNEGPVHEVIVPKPFYLAAYPTTQEQYARVLGSNPSRFQGAAGGGPNHPVEMVSWDEAAAFCRALTELAAERDAKRTYRLPTEAEWEYACRAGTRTPFHFGPSLGASQARIDGAYPYGDAAKAQTVPRTAPVGTFPANTWGLSDMHGNVWEWCADWFEDRYYQQSPRQEPRGPDSGTYRVLRGGSWKNQAATCRSAYRNALAPNQRQPFLGFRVALIVSE